MYYYYYCATMNLYETNILDIQQQLQQWKFSFIFIYFSTIWIKLSKGKSRSVLFLQKIEKKDYQQECIHSTVNSRKVVLLRRAKYHTSKKNKENWKKKIKSSSHITKPLAKPFFLFENIAIFLTDILKSGGNFLFHFVEMIFRLSVLFF